MKLATLGKDRSVETKLEANQKNLYQTDYYQWIKTTLDNMRSQDYESIDWDNLIEEVEDMGRRERRSLESNLVVILLHLLKWDYQPNKRTGSWRRSILEHRRRICRALKDSPSLKPYLAEIFPECYSDAVKQASAETGLPVEKFPLSCPYSLSTVLED